MTKYVETKGSEPVLRQGDIGHRGHAVTSRTRASASDDRHGYDEKFVIDRDKQNRLVHTEQSCCLESNGSKRLGSSGNVKLARCNRTDCTNLDRSASGERNGTRYTARPRTLHYSPEPSDDDCSLASNHHAEQRQHSHYVRRAAAVRRSESVYHQCRLGHHNDVPTGVKELNHHNPRSTIVKRIRMLTLRSGIAVGGKLLKTGSLAIAVNAVKREASGGQEVVSHLNMTSAQQQ